MKLYLVGGAVRDHVLGRATKDYDFAVEARDYNEMIAELITHYGITIWQERKEFGIVRGRVHGSSLGGFGGMVPQNAWVDADFTLCRTDGPYSDSRHPDYVLPTTITGDLARRDFTMNAMAMTADGDLLDPWSGKVDLGLRMLRAVGDPVERFTEDPLRMLRAVRFSVCLDLYVQGATAAAMSNPVLVNNLDRVVVDRVREELHRALRHDWWRTMELLTGPYQRLGWELRKQFPGLWLSPTTEER
jgi:tRNA nucleotidyltransferase (CCA-adding enzyme)